MPVERGSGRLAGSGTGKHHPPSDTGRGVADAALHGRHRTAAGVGADEMVGCRGRCTSLVLWYLTWPL